MLIGFHGDCQGDGARGLLEDSTILALANDPSLEGFQHADCRAEGPDPLPRSFHGPACHLLKSQPCHHILVGTQQLHHKEAEISYTCGLCVPDDLQCMSCICK